MTPDEARQLFLDHLPVIERITREVTADFGLRGADAEDFASAAKLKFIENDYATIRRCHDVASLSGYFAAVIANVYRDQRVHERGRWRPSSMATRAGGAAVLLERLIAREGMSFSDATQIVQQQFPAIELAELERLSAGFPQRRPRAREEHLDSLPEPMTADTAEDALLRKERASCATKISTALKTALATLAPQDRLIVRMHIVDGYRVATIARTLRVEQMWLYRHIRAILRQLRKAVAMAGVNDQEVKELLTYGSENLELAFDSMNRHAGVVSLAQSEGESIPPRGAP